MKNLKPFNLAAAILGLFGNLIFFIFGLIALIGFISVTDATGAGLVAGGILLVILILIFTILGVIFSSLSFTAATANDAIYLRKKGINITAIVFSLLSFILAFVFALVGGTTVYTVVMVITVLLLLAAVALYITDLCLTLSRISKESNSQQAENEPTSETKTKSDANS